jgi:hypothetical protein
MEKERKRSTTYWGNKVRLVSNIVFGTISFVALMLWLRFSPESFFSLQTLISVVIFVVVFFVFNRWTRESREVKKGFTNLMYFAANGKKWEVIDLLSNGADLNEQDSAGGTALIYAARNGQQEIVRILLERGAVKSIQTHGGKNAAAIARANGYDVIADQIDGYIEGQPT